MKTATWTSTRGRYTCSPAHGGVFLVMSVAADPTATAHQTPRETWVRYAGPGTCTTCLRNDLPQAA